MTVAFTMSLDLPLSIVNEFMHYRKKIEYTQFLSDLKPMLICLQEKVIHCVVCRTKGLAVLVNEKYKMVSLS